ncbi:MAG TPA: tRNA 4-thiouridine(8) synthase ThiI, partial [Nitrospiria bacterium]
ASYQMLKRGCRMSFVHFHSHPLLDRTSQEKVVELVQHLTRHQYRSRLYRVPFAEIQRRIVLGAPPALRVVLYRRMMMRLAEDVAARERAGVLVTGESLGQVASQTMENITVIQAAAVRPVLRPLIGLDKEEITAMARRIGTYETSIIPDQDCCRLFIPDHPAVKARLTDVERAERELDISALVKLGAEGMEVDDYEFPGVAAPRTIA